MRVRSRVDYSVVMGYNALQDEYRLFSYMCSPREEISESEQKEKAELLERVREYMIQNY
jgi:hypothetical protein